MRWWIVVTCLLAAIVGGSSSPGAAAQTETDCMTDPLGPLPGYSVITAGDVNVQNSETDGRLAAGGSVTLTAFGIATKLTPDRTRVDLATGANLTDNYSGINNGSVTYVGTVTPANLTVPNGTVSRAAMPFDVPALFDA